MNKKVKREIHIKGTTFGYELKDRETIDELVEYNEMGDIISISQNINDYDFIMKVIKQ